mgnify:CR=1 FL=1
MAKRNEYLLALQQKEAQEKRVTKANAICLDNSRICQDGCPLRDSQECPYNEGMRQNE